MDFEWEKGAWFIREQESLPGVITIPDPDTKTPVALERKEPWDAVKTLGVMLNMIGTDNDEASYLLLQTEQWAERIRYGHLRWADAWFSLQCVILKTLEYTMVAISLGRAQWDDIMRPLLDAGLRAAGVCQKFPSAAIYGSLDHLALEVEHPYVLQPLLQSQVLQRHGDQDNEIGKLLRSNIEQLQLELGTGKPFFQDDYNQLHRLASHSWMASLWEFSWKNELCIDHTFPTLRLLATEDSFLMDQFSRTDFSKVLLVCINICRLYLRVCTLSEISTAEGLRITKSGWTGQRDISQKTRYEWPHLARPGPSFWRDWQTALQATLQSPPSHIIPDTLRPCSGTTMLSDWNWVSADENCILHREGTLWRYWQQSTLTRQTRASRYYPNSLCTDPFPLHMLPLSIVRTSPKRIQVIAISTIFLLQSPLAKTTPSNIAEAIANDCIRNPSEQWALEKS